MNTCSWDVLGAPWWMGERGMYHAECMVVRDAHDTCTCIMPVTNASLTDRAFVCGSCGLMVRLVDTRRMRQIRILKEAPYGVRPILPIVDPR